jgi:hypothetical protein
MRTAPGAAVPEFEDVPDFDTAASADVALDAELDDLLNDPTA